MRFSSFAFFTWRSPRRFHFWICVYFLAFFEVHVNSLIFLWISLCYKTRLCISLIHGIWKFQTYPIFSPCWVKINHATGENSFLTKLVCEFRNRRMAREHSLRLFFYIAVRSGLSPFCSVSPWLVLFGIPYRF